VIATTTNTSHCWSRVKRLFRAMTAT
jgi:hypothetical protein